MTKEEFERILTETGWERRYHGTHCNLWHKPGKFIDVSDKGVELTCLPRLPWDTVSVKDGKLIIGKEVEL